MRLVRAGNEGAAVGVRPACEPAPARDHNGGVGLAAWQWVLLGLAALLVGFAKTAIGGAASISVVAFAAVLPARQSTGILLPLLICGDVMAVSIYRRHANWPLLLRLFPWVGAGLCVGTAFVKYVDDSVMRHTIGAILLVIVVLQLNTRRRAAANRKAVPDEDAPAEHAATAASPRTPRTPQRPKRRRGLAGTAGVLAGFATMVANAAGPIMTVYLFLSGTEMLAFLGTSAWFFFVINIVKLPFSAALGLLAPASLRLDLMLAPAVVAGGIIGALTVRRLRPHQFELWATLLAAVSAAFLLLI